MDDIQDFITDHHYNQAIRKKSVVSPEDAIAEAVLDVWPVLPREEEEKESLEAFTAALVFEDIYATPVGRFFLVQKLLAAQSVKESEYEGLDKVIKFLEEFHLEKQLTWFIVERMVAKLSTSLKHLTIFSEWEASIKRKCEILKDKFLAEQARLEEEARRLRLESNPETSSSSADNIPEVDSTSTATRNIITPEDDGGVAERKQDDEESRLAEERSPPSPASPAADTAASKIDSTKVDKEIAQAKEEKEEEKNSESADEEGGNRRTGPREGEKEIGLLPENTLMKMSVANKHQGSARVISAVDDLSGDSYGDLPNVRVQLDSIFKSAYEDFFDELESALKELHRKALPSFLADPVAVAKYRQLAWFSQKREVAMNDFIIFRDLGRGAFGVVSGARHRMTGQMVALKGMNRRMIKHKKVIKLVKGEFEILKTLGEFPSPFCVSLSYAFCEKNDMFFGLPLMTGGDLMFHIYREQAPYGVERARFFAAEILLGIAHMHSLGIIYRDLKPENVLLDEHGHTKISDMGLAVMVKFTPYTRGKKLIRGRAGTPGYWPPEMLQSEGYAFDCDWWSYASMVFEFLLGVCPFSEHNSKMERNEATLKWEIQFPPKFDKDAEDLLRKMLDRNRTTRLGVSPDTPDELKKHPFFASIDWAVMETGKAIPPWRPPSNSINAISQADLETRNQESKYKKVQLTEEDNIEGLNFKSREHLYDIATVLHLERKGKLEHLKALKKQSQACAIL